MDIQHVKLWIDNFSRLKYLVAEIKLVLRALLSAGNFLL